MNKLRNILAVSIRYSSKKDLWQIRMGSSKVEYSTPSLKWAMAWGKWYGESYMLPVRILVPDLDDPELGLPDVTKEKEPVWDQEDPTKGIGVTP